MHWAKREAVSAMAIEAEEVEAALPDNFIINHTWVRQETAEFYICSAKFQSALVQYSLVMLPFLSLG